MVFLIPKVGVVLVVDDFDDKMEELEIGLLEDVAPEVFAEDDEADEVVKGFEELVDSFEDDRETEDDLEVRIDVCDRYY